MAPIPARPAARLAIPLVDRRQLVLRIIDAAGNTAYEHAIPLSQLGPHQNSMATVQLRATIESMPPSIVEIGAMNIPPWGDGE